MFSAEGQCDICKKEHTSMRMAIKTGVIGDVCPSCLEKTRDNFIWLCMNCGKSYFRPKESVINRLKRLGIEKASQLCTGVQLIQGIDICIECNPKGILRYVNIKNSKFDVEVCIN